MSLGEIVVSMAKDAGFKVFKRDGSMVRNIALPFTELNLFSPEAIAVDSCDNNYSVGRQYEEQSTSLLS